MKSVLISIQPKWCELIASGKKTIEVRKTRPKIDTPFKCYIYCTKAKKKFMHGGIVDTLEDLYRMPDGEIRFGYSGELMCCNEENGADNFLNGKVIGEFVCDGIIDFYEETLIHDELNGSPVESWLNWEINDNLCKEMNLYTMEDVEKCTYLKESELLLYLCPKMQGYGWHISDLVIYDKPKELREFYKKCKSYDKDEYDIDNLDCIECENPCGNGGKIYLKRPPQSWCYVDSIE